MPVSDKNKLIFVHIPKNAGTTITENLDMNSDIGHHFWYYYNRKYPKKWVDYTTFCVSRNPWDRVVSCYEYARMENSYWHSVNGKSKEGKHPDYDLLKNMSFEDCVKILKNNPNALKHQGWKSQHSYVLHGNSIMVDKVLSLENLNEGLLELVPNLNNIGHVNKSKDKDYKSYYNDDTKDIVASIYEKDIKLFNYSF